jgi:tetrahydromethanopterin S-methyltransferase subunit G
MYIFIDESGIHKKVDNSSFALVYIEVEDFNAIEKRICEIEKELKIEKFHWSEIAWKFKEKFIQKVLKLDFKVKIAIIKNPVNPAKELERILSHMAIEKNISCSYIDGKKPRWYELKIKKVLRDKGVSANKVKMVRDDQIACVRLADMVAGLSRSHFDRKNEKRLGNYYKMLEKKLVILMQ